MLLFASSAASLSSPLGGFLCGVIIPLPMYPLSAIHPEGSRPSSSPEGAWCGHVVHGAGVGIRPTRACRRAGPGSEAFMPIVLCLPDHNSR